MNYKKIGFEVKKESKRAFVLFEVVANLENKNQTSCNELIRTDFENAKIFEDGELYQALKKFAQHFAGINEVKGRRINYNNKYTIEMGIFTDENDEMLTDEECKKILGLGKTIL